MVVEGERAENQPPQIKRFFVIEDDSELSGRDIENPEQTFDPNTNAPVVTMEFTDEGREAFARVTKRLADRGARIILPPGSDREQAFQRFAITLDNKIVSLATIDFVQNPEGIDGRNGRPDRGHRDDRGDPGPRREPAHRRPADRAQADLADAGVGHARPAGARPGPHGRRGGARAHDHLPAHLLPGARRGRDGRAHHLRDLPVRAREADPDHAHASGHRGARAHAGGGGRRQHRHVRANKGGGQSRALDSERDLSGLLQGAQDDHRRQRRHDRRRVHPLHACHGGRQGLRVHARRRHDRVAVHGRAGHVGDPRHTRAHAPPAAAERPRRQPQGARAAGSSTSWASRAGSSPSRA